MKIQALEESNGALETARNRLEADMLRLDNVRTAQQDQLEALQEAEQKALAQIEDLRTHSANALAAQKRIQIDLREELDALQGQLVSTQAALEHQKLEYLARPIQTSPLKEAPVSPITESDLETPPGSPPLSPIKGTPHRNVTLESETLKGTLYYNQSKMLKQKKELEKEKRQRLLLQRQVKNLQSDLESIRQLHGSRLPQRRIAKKGDSEAPKRRIRNNDPFMTYRTSTHVEYLSDEGPWEDQEELSDLRNNSSSLSLDFTHYTQRANYNESTESLNQTDEEQQPLEMNSSSWSVRSEGSRPLSSSTITSLHRNMANSASHINAGNNFSTSPTRINLQLELADVSGTNSGANSPDVSREPNTSHKVQTVEDDVHRTPPVQPLDLESTTTPIKESIDAGMTTDLTILNWNDIVALEASMPTSCEAPSVDSMQVITTNLGLSTPVAAQADEQPRALLKDATTQYDLNGDAEAILCSRCGWQDVRRDVTATASDSCIEDVRVSEFLRQDNKHSESPRIFTGIAAKLEGSELFREGDEKVDSLPLPCSSEEIQPDNSAEIDMSRDSIEDVNVASEQTLDPSPDGTDLTTTTGAVISPFTVQAPSWRGKSTITNSGSQLIVARELLSQPPEFKDLSDLNLELAASRKAIEILTEQKDQLVKQLHSYLGTTELVHTVESRADQNHARCAEYVSAGPLNIIPDSRIDSPSQFRRLSIMDNKLSTSTSPARHRSSSIYASSSVPSPSKADRVLGKSDQKHLSSSKSISSSLRSLETGISHSAAIHMAPPQAPSTARDTIRGRQIKGRLPSRQINQSTSREADTLANPSRNYSIRSISSLSSFASDIDDRFASRRHIPESLSLIENSTNPATIESITRTMIGMSMYKYTRLAGRQGLSENRHKRYFWIHPYTKTLYWSVYNPVNAPEGAIIKSAPILDFYIEDDFNSMPPGLHQRSLCISTPRRILKVTALHNVDHDDWTRSLNFLLYGPPPEDKSYEANRETEELIRDFSPTRHAATGLLHSVSGKFDSQRTVRPTSSSQRSRLSERSLSRKVSEFFRSGVSPVGSVDVLRDANATALADRSVNAPTDRQLSLDDVSEGLGLENVRSCCGGKHDVTDLCNRLPSPVRNPVTSRNLG